MLQTGAQLALIVRFCWTGLHRRYRYLFAYLVLALVQTVVLLFVRFDSRTYVDYWMISEGLIVFCWVLIVLNLYSMILQDFVAIAATAQRYTTAALAVAVIASLLLVNVENLTNTRYNYFLLCDRAVLSSLVILVLASLAFLVYYPIPISKNVAIYSIGFTAYLFPKAVALLIGNVSRYAWYRQINVVFIGLPLAGLLFWLLMLNREGEKTVLIVAPQWRQGEEEILLQRLKSINDQLLRGAKK